jgi:hypothetical protein
VVGREWRLGPGGELVDARVGRGWGAKVFVK